MKANIKIRLLKNKRRVWSDLRVYMLMKIQNWNRQIKVFLARVLNILK